MTAPANRATHPFKRASRRRLVDGRGRIRGSCGVVLAVGLITPGCSNEVEKPEPPDMSALVQIYRTPTGTFDDAAAATLKDQVSQALDLLDSSALIATLRDAMSGGINGLRDEQTEALSAEVRQKRQPFSLSANGYANAVRTCNGWASTPTANRDANGSISVTFGFSERGLDPVIWGDAVRCRYVVDGRQVELDRAGDGSSVKAYIGDAATFDNYDEQPLIFAFNLTGIVDGTSQSLHLDFQYAPSTEAIGMRVSGTGGDIIVETSEGEIVQVRAANGTFQCDQDRCTSSDQSIEL